MGHCIAFLSLSTTRLTLSTVVAPALWNRAQGTETALGDTIAPVWSAPSWASGSFVSHKGDALPFGFFLRASTVYRACNNQVAVEFQIPSFHAYTFFCTHLSSQASNAWYPVISGTVLPKIRYISEIITGLSNSSANAGCLKPPRVPLLYPRILSLSVHETARATRYAVPKFRGGSPPAVPQPQVSAAGGVTGPSIRCGPLLLLPAHRQNCAHPSPI